MKYSVCLLLVVFSLGIAVQAQETEIQDISGKLSAGLTSAGKKNVAVVDFTDLQGCVTELGRFMAEEFSDSLAEQGKGFQVIDRTNLNVIMRENHLAEQGIIDPSVARKLGQIAGVDALIAGTLTPVDNAVHVSIKVLDSTSARIITAARGDITRTKGIDELLAKGVMNCNPSASIPASPTPTQNSSGASAVKSPPTITTAQFGDIVVSILGCKRNGDEIVCFGSVANNGRERVALMIDTEKSYMVDNLGNQSKVVSNFEKIKARIGSEGTYAWLEPELPLRIVMSGDGLSGDASLVSLSLTANINSNGQWSVRVLRNIPIQAK